MSIAPECCHWVLSIAYCCLYLGSCGDHLPVVLVDVVYLWLPWPCNLKWTLQKDTSLSQPQWLINMSSSLISLEKYLHVYVGWYEHVYVVSFCVSACVCMTLVTAVNALHEAGFDDIGWDALWVQINLPYDQLEIVMKEVCDVHKHDKVDTPTCTPTCMFRIIKKAPNCLTTAPQMTAYHFQLVGLHFVMHKLVHLSW